MSFQEVLAAIANGIVVISGCYGFYHWALPTIRRYRVRFQPPLVIERRE